MNRQRIQLYALGMMLIALLLVGCSASPTPTPIPPTATPIPPTTTPVPPPPVPTQEPLPSPEQAVRSAVEQALQGGAIPYKDVSTQTLSNDGTYATVRVTAWFRPKPECNWVQQAGDIEARNIGGQWKVTTPVINLQATPGQAAACPTTPSPTPQSYYHLINRHTQKCLAAQVGTQWIVQETCQDGAPQQLWRIPSGATQINLQTLTNVCVGYNNYNNKLVQVGCNPNILPWTLIPMGTYYSVPSPISLPHAHPTTVPTAFGQDSRTTYYLLQYSGHCVDDDGWSHAEGQVTIHDDCRLSNNDNQLWRAY